MTKKLWISLALLAVVAVRGGAQAGAIRRASEPIPNRYIVVLAGNDDPLAVGLQAAATHNGQLVHVYDHAVHGFAIRLTPAAAASVASDPRVRYVEEDGVVHAVDTETSAPWGLDRIDQRALPLDGLYNYPTGGSAVYVHVIDTGIRPTHVDFGGRASIGGDFITPSTDGIDCNGHGTHVAGTIAGTTYGVAKSATIIAYRALNCSGSGAVSGIVAAIDQVTADGRRPAVANMSLGGSPSTTLDSAVQQSVAAGVTFVVAAGNSNADASQFSPSRVSEAITVAASASNDAKASFSNFGSIVDLYAPGVSITSAWYTSDTATAVLSGTSMASPHVAGAAALYLQSAGDQPPATVSAALTSNATAGVITGNPNGTPNLLLYTGFLLGPPPPPPPSPTLTADPNSITAGQSSTLTLTTPTNNYHNIFINGVRPSCVYGSNVVCTMTVSPTVTTLYQSEAINGNGVPYTMPSVTVTVTSPPPPPPPPSPTLTADPNSISPGQSSTLTLTTPTNNYHNIFINGVRPNCVYGSNVVCTMTVSPTVTTLYQSEAINGNGVPYTMPSVTVTVVP